MCIEIEAKFKVDSLAEIAGKLNQLGAEFLEEQQQSDYYFDDAKSDMMKSDRCLRVRKLLNDENERVFLTYKGPKEKSRFKQRKEIKVKTDDCDSTRKLLLEIGYQQKLVVEKKRQIWRLDDCEIALDELPLLGTFVEIEADDEEKIANVQKKLNLEQLSHIGEGYAVLMVKKLVLTNKDG